MIKSLHLHIKDKGFRLWLKRAKNRFIKNGGFGYLQLLSLLPLLLVGYEETNDTATGGLLFLYTLLLRFQH